MKTKELCFVDFGLEHITLLVAYVDDGRVIEVPFLEILPIKIPVQRIQSPLLQQDNFDALIKLIDKAEQELNINIAEIIFIVKDASIKHFLTRSKLEFKTIQKVSQMTIEKLAKKSIGDFCNKQIQEYHILDFIKHNFLLDKEKILPNPYKIKCKNIELRASIFAVKKVFTKTIGTILERYKIHTKHYITPCTCLWSLAQEQLSSGLILLVDIGSCETEFMISYKDIIVYQGIINIGGIDMSRDIADMMKLYIGDADELKCKLNNFNNNKASIEIEKINSLATEIADARLEEIALCIYNEINDKYSKKITLNKIILAGGVSNYKNANAIFQQRFSTKLEMFSKKNIINDRFVRNKIDDNKINFSTLPVIGALSFYMKNQEIYKNAKHGFIFHIGSKISCFLKDLLY